MAAPRTLDALRDNIESVLLGKEEAIELVIATFLAGGHLLIEDVPGVGKTTLARALAASVGCSFQRIQFTSDMLPSDILGVSVFEEESGGFVFRPGPIFSSIVLADEINRTSPKTQSALLEAMNEGQVSVDGSTHELPGPFMVLATQNPLEFHGTYPLPESQLDRFMMRIKLGYPGPDVERELLLTRGRKEPVDSLAPVADAKDLLNMMEEVDRVRIDDSLVDYLLRLVSMTRSLQNTEAGVSPRGALQFQRAAKALALTRGRQYVIPDDVKMLAVPCLAHRLIVAETSDSGFNQTEAMIMEIMTRVSVPV